MAFEYPATVAYFISTATPDQLLDIIQSIRLGAIAEVEDCGLFVEGNDEHKYRFVINLARCPNTADWQKTWDQAFQAFLAAKGVQFREVRWYINQPHG